MVDLAVGDNDTKPVEFMVRTVVTTFPSQMALKNGLFYSHAADLTRNRDG